MQYQIKNILVPIDFSSSSLQALETAATIAKNNRAQVYLVHVNHWYDVEEPCCPPNSKQAGTLLTSWLADAISHEFEIETKWIELDGTPHRQLTHWLRSHPCDLVVMGTSGFTTTPIRQIGTTTYHLLKYATCPVLLMPAGRGKRSFSKVVYSTRPVSGSMVFFNIVKSIVGHAANMQVLLHTYRPDDDHRNGRRHIEKEVGKELKETGIEWEVQYCTNQDIANETIITVQQTQADLLVLTPSLGKINCIGYIDSEIRTILNGALMPILYLMNNAFRTSKPEAALLSRF
jgi:nucleotide-binding universal stress UspA family protein